VKTRRRTKGFTLLPVVLAMTLIASIAFLLNRSNAVNANMVASRADVERARYAAEAGLQAVNYVIQQEGCIGIYPTAGEPLVDSAFGGSAYSAYASAPVGSPLTLTSTGTHNGASVTLSRSNAYVYQAGVKTYTLQPNASGIDTRLHVGHEKENYGDSDELKIKADEWESLLRFDVGFFPQGSRVVPWFDSSTGSLQAGALLQIYKKSNHGTPSKPEYIDALVITRGGWLEGNGADWSGATWTHYDGVRTWPQPGVGYDTRPDSTNLARNTEGWQSIILTDAVRAWMGTVYTNNGIWLRSSPSGDPVGDYKYHSSEHTSDPTHRPRLRLYYLLPCWTAAP
jgi:Tfp pilus assembly protein PilX